MEEMNDLSYEVGGNDELSVKKKKESVIEKLNKSLADSEITPDDV